MLFKFNELVDGIEKMAIKPGWQLNQGTRTPPGGRVRRPGYREYFDIVNRNLRDIRYNISSSESPFSSILIILRNNI
jgi:hypothetical protein